MLTVGEKCTNGVTVVINVQLLFESSMLFINTQFFLSGTWCFPASLKLGMTYDKFCLRNVNGNQFHIWAEALKSQNMSFPCHTPVTQQQMTCQ